MKFPDDEILFSQITVKGQENWKMHGRITKRSLHLRITLSKFNCLGTIQNEFPILLFFFSLCSGTTWTTLYWLQSLIDLAFVSHAKQNAEKSFVFIYLQSSSGSKMISWQVDLVNFLVFTIACQDVVYCS